MLSMDQFNVMVGCGLHADPPPPPSPPPPPPPPSRASPVCVCGCCGRGLVLHISGSGGPCSWLGPYPAINPGCGHVPFWPTQCVFTLPPTQPPPPPPPLPVCRVFGLDGRWWEQCSHTWFGRSCLAFHHSPVVEAFDRHVCAHPPTAPPSITPINLTPPPPTPTLPCLPGGGAACGWRTSL